MALPSSGAISLANIQTEFGGSNPISLSEYYRGGAYVTDNNTGVPTSGAIQLDDFYGAVKQFQFTISTSYTTTQNLRSLALAAGWNGTDPVRATIGSGVYIYGTYGSAGAQSYGSNGVAGGNGSEALTISGSFPGGLILVNNGTLYGGGGAGGNGGSTGNGGNGGAGGAGLLVSTAITIFNYGTIAGGGGGGGGGPAWGAGGVVRSGGGGGGGAVYGRGGIGGDWEGIDGGTGSIGGLTTGGSGGSSDQGLNTGGTGGALATAGSAGNNPAGGSPGAGGAAGPAVSGNSFITWSVTGTRTGALV